MQKQKKKTAVFISTDRVLYCIINMLVIDVVFYLYILCVIVIKINLTKIQTWKPEATEATQNRGDNY
jgi:hypothetical protein